MPAATNDSPTVALSFANNFWGKDDAGVSPLLERMHYAKQTCDELRSFYSTRASIEDEYARKMLSLSRKSLGSHETGSLKHSLDTVRGEVESMAKQHQSIGAQMKSELEEPLAAFAGGMKERRKIIQNGIEKLLKIKIQQTQTVNKTRDRFEQECLKIKGYLAQGHMVMGQEERKNKAKLEKTQINVATSNTEYENAVKALEDTTARWNREWKAAADKFQDLEEERLDFTKSSLWTFANIASTVCVSDDASCEKVRLSLETMDVEQDIATFINESGTGQEIPDAPKYVNFCRGDVSDSQSESSDDENYSVAQFPRSINPAFRTSSPQPSTYESHHDPNSTLARDFGHTDPGTPPSREQTLTPQKLPAPASGGQRQPPPQVPPPQQQPRRQFEAPEPPTGGQRQPPPQSYLPQQQSRPQFDATDFAPVPHDPYPMDGMTMLCRPGPAGSDLSVSQPPSARPSSRDSQSDYSNPTSFEEPSSGKVSPAKQEAPIVENPEKRVLKKKSGFFQNHSPFRRKSTKGAQTSHRNTWAPATSQSGQTPGSRRPRAYGSGSEGQNLLADRAVSPDPIDANASLALNVGNNVFAVSNAEREKKASANSATAAPEDDPIALALAELKGVNVGKQSSIRVSADRYHGIATPAPGAQPSSRSVPAPGPNGGVIAAGMRGTPPPSYDQQVQRLGVPQPAVTSKAMKETSRKFVEQTQHMFNPNRPGSGGYSTPTRSGTRATDIPRAASPAPPRSASPRPVPGSDLSTSRRSASPNPYTSNQPRAGSNVPRSASPNGYASSQRGGGSVPRSASPNPYASSQRSGASVPRSASPNPYASSQRGGASVPRSASPNPYASSQRGGASVPRSASPNGYTSSQRGGGSVHRSASPNPYTSSQQRQGSNVSTTPKRGSDQGYYRHNSPNDVARSLSPAPYRDYGRPGSSHINDMSVQLAPVPDNVYGSQRGRSNSRPGTSSGSRAMGFYEGAGQVRATSRPRSKSVVDPSRQYTPDGRPIIHFARALYMYQAAIPEELGFAKGDILAILRHQDDGWWEAEVHGGNGRIGLVPSNYLQPC